MAFPSTYWRRGAGGGPGEKYVKLREKKGSQYGEKGVTLTGANGQMEGKWLSNKRKKQSN